MNIKIKKNIMFLLGILCISLALLIWVNGMNTKKKEGMTSDMPTSDIPTSDMPTTYVPTTYVPTTYAPTTYAPTTYAPTTTGVNNIKVITPPSTYVKINNTTTTEQNNISYGLDALGSNLEQIKQQNQLNIRLEKATEKQLEQKTAELKTKQTELKTKQTELNKKTSDLKIKQTELDKTKSELLSIKKKYKIK